MRQASIAIAVILLLALSLALLPDSADAANAALLSYKTDAQGVYVTDYGYSFDGLGIQYNPVSIANYALELWSAYKETGDEAYLDRFMVQADWFYAWQSVDGTWKYGFDIPSYCLEAPWISCMAQGLGMQVLSYAYSVTNDEAYLQKAKHSITPFYYALRDGGVRSSFPDGTPWYEEYACDGTPYYKVLNGYIFALQGMAKYLDNHDDETVAVLLDEGIEALDKKVALYDAGYLSFYDAAGHINVDYNPVHVSQLLYFYKRTGNDRFRLYARRFDTYEPKPNLRIGNVVKGQQSPWILIDGNKLNGKTWTKSNSAAQLQIDMRSVRALDGVNIFFADRKNVSSSVQIAVSSDTKKWSTIAPSAFTLRGAYYPRDTKQMYIQMYYLKQPLNARFLRFVFNQGKSKTIHLKEIHPMYNQNPSKFERIDEQLN